MVDDSESISYSTSAVFNKLFAEPKLYYQSFKSSTMKTIWKRWRIESAIQSSYQNKYKKKDKTERFLYNQHFFPTLVGGPC